MAVQKHSIAQARAQLPQLVREAEGGKTVELTRRGEPVAVLIGRRAYDRLTAGPGGFSSTYAVFVSRMDLHQQKIDPEEIFGNLRDRAKGREVPL